MFASFAAKHISTILNTCVMYLIFFDTKQKLHNKNYDCFERLKKYFE
jgi:hypothetical protein